MRTTRLPDWLSWPVLIATPVAGGVLTLLVLTQPAALALTVPPAALLGAALLAIGLLAPTTPAARLHAVLWGSTVVVVLAVVINTATELAVGTTPTALVVAPLVEETAILAGLAVLAARRQIPGPLGGAILAVSIAAGFAVAENLAMFTVALDQGGATVGEVFITRGLLTPFAHPLFSVWMGVGVGYAGRWQQAGLGRGLVVGGSWLVAVLLHGAWNAAALGYPTTTPPMVVLGLFSCLLVATVVALAAAHRRERTEIAAVIQRHGDDVGLYPDEALLLTSTQLQRDLRRHLTHQQCAHLDALVGATYQLAWVRGGTEERAAGIEEVTQALRQWRLTLGAD